MSDRNGTMNHSQPPGRGRLQTMSAFPRGQATVSAPSPDEIAALLRPLARKAVGMSGADVERLVREARGRARRERRQLSWDDIAAMLDASRPQITDDLRWRVAIHESGHAVARLALGRGDINMITIDSRSGGFVQVREDVIEAQTEAWIMRQIVVCLAGRAAEIAFFGAAAAGAGGSEASDLGTATALALSMETEVGYAQNMPLVYRKASDGVSSLIYRPDLAAQVNARLEEADRVVAAIIGRHRAAVEMLARELMIHLTLEGEQLRTTLDRIGAVIRDHAEAAPEQVASAARSNDADTEAADPGNATCRDAGPQQSRARPSEPDRPDPHGKP